TESGPPDTARTSPTAPPSGASSISASSGEIGRSSSGGATALSRSGGSAFRTAALTLDALAYARRGLWIALADLRIDPARLLALPDGCERHAELEHRVGGSGRLRIVGRDLQELLAGLLEAAPLVIALAEPVGRVGHQPVARMRLQELAKAHFRLLKLL